jgi:hypothetical protein
MPDLVSRQNLRFQRGHSVSIGRLLGSKLGGELHKQNLLFLHELLGQLLFK